MENDETIISKNDFVKSLKEKAPDLDKFTYEDEEFDATEDDALLMNTVSSKASFICRRLEEAGWIDVAMNPDTFEENGNTQAGQFP